MTEADINEILREYEDLRDHQGNDEAHYLFAYVPREYVGQRIAELALTQPDADFHGARFTWGDNEDGGIGMLVTYDPSVTTVDGEICVNHQRRYISVDQGSSLIEDESIRIREGMILRIYVRTFTNKSRTHHVATKRVYLVTATGIENITEDFKRLNDD